MVKAKQSRPKRFGNLSASELQEIRELRAPVDAIRAARARAKAEGKEPLYKAASEMPLTDLQRLSAARDALTGRVFAELLRRVDKRQAIGAKAGARRAISEEEKAKWLALAMALRAKNGNRSMTDIANAVGKRCGRSGRAVRKHLTKFWERS